MKANFRHLAAVTAAPQLCLPRRGFMVQLARCHSSGLEHTKNLRPFRLEQMEEWYACSSTLSNSDCEPLSLADVLSLASDEHRMAWASLALGYPTHNTGSPSLLNSIADLYSGKALEGIKHITSCVPQEGIFVSVTAILEQHPGHVVVQAPSYQSLFEVARTQAASVSLWEPSLDSAHPEMLQFDVGRLEELVTPSTTLIILNLPHNPTGTSLDKAAFSRVVDIASKHGAFLFVDEMYRGLEHASLDTNTWPGPAALPAAVDAYERGVSLGGMSKVFGAAGLRLGWVATQCHATTRRLREIKDYTSICPATTSELLAQIILSRRDVVLGRNRRILRDGLAAVKRFVAARPLDLTWCEPAGGTTVFPRLVGGASAKAYTKRLAGDRTGAAGQETEQGGLMLVPSSAFEYGDSHVRFGVGRADVSSCLARLAAMHDKAMEAAREAEA
mmetsp:Transcript_8933/g.17860  ORF Transcript_8933/g.17860 Transcript_8933/m.17860 type:complete len:445 (-) Transcript_8933:113-1447(-)